MRHRKNKTNRMVARLPADPDMLNDDMCGPYNRKGLLCGSCRDGYGLAVYSLSLDCADCSKLSTISALCLYLLVVFLPITIFFFCVIFFRIKITTGSLLPYVMFFRGFQLLWNIKKLFMVPLCLTYLHVINC